MGLYKYIYGLDFSDAYLSDQRPVPKNLPYGFLISVSSNEYFPVNKPPASWDK